MGAGAPRAPRPERPAAGGGARPERMGAAEGPTPVLAVDCEMVGLGPGGVRSSLARRAPAALHWGLSGRQLPPPPPLFLGCRGEGRQVFRWSDRSASARRAARPRSEACSRTAAPRGGSECRRASTARSSHGRPPQASMPGPARVCRCGRAAPGAAAAGACAPAAQRGRGRAGPLTPRARTRRVCIVNSAGAVLLDRPVAQAERVTDYRTRFSGIRPRDLAGAPPLSEARRTPRRKRSRAGAWMRQNS